MNLLREENTYRFYEERNKKQDNRIYYYLVMISKKIFY